MIVFRAPNHSTREPTVTYHERGPGRGGPGSGDAGRVQALDARAEGRTGRRHEDPRAWWTRRLKREQAIPALASHLLPRCRCGMWCGRVVPPNQRTALTGRCTKADVPSRHWAGGSRSFGGASSKLNPPTPTPANLAPSAAANSQGHIRRRRRGRAEQSPLPGVVDPPPSEQALPVPVPLPAPQHSFPPGHAAKQSTPIHARSSLPTHSNHPAGPFFPRRRDPYLYASQDKVERLGFPSMAPPVELTLVVAATRAMGIGAKGTLPWTGLRKEMAYFARVTKRLPPKVAHPPFSHLLPPFSSHSPINAISFS